MNICESCKHLRPVNICTGSIIIGTVLLPNSNYNIFFVSLANGLRVHYTAVSDNTGLLTLTPLNGFIFATEHLYQLFINQTNSVSRGDELVIGITTSRCYNIEFVEVKDYPQITQTLEVA